MKFALPLLSNEILFYLSESGSAYLAWAVNEVLGYTRHKKSPLTSTEFEQAIEFSVYELHQNNLIFFRADTKLAVHFPPPSYQPRFHIFNALLESDPINEGYVSLIGHGFDDHIELIITEAGLKTQQ